MNETDCLTDCRTKDGITVGLIDSIINAGHLLQGRDLTSEAVFEAIADLKSHALLSRLFSLPQTEWRVVYRHIKDPRLAGERLFVVESEARAFVAGRMQGGTSIPRTWQGNRKEVGLQKRDFGVRNAPWVVVEFKRPANPKLVKAKPNSDLYRLGLPAALEARP